ncbi:hypothetical protein KIH41_09375 [Litoribacter ruber]|uniref:hypothetical protein n=1 Tax=Litoribacter ruber TaxID=702568 RepID=UPI001BDB6746|nr:hypothetical protein [Litoribacter ruber]MBT0811487.1 hypothetical protein [Litoribacter ruber]
MHLYIPYLLQDIANAHRAEPQMEESPWEDPLEGHFEAVEKYLSRAEPEHTFGHYCGLQSEDFPPAEQLSVKEMKLVCKAFERMMSSWNLDISLPNKLPAHIAYRMMVETLDSKTEIVNFGFIGIDFCTGDPSGCEFKEYCPCLENYDKLNEGEGFEDPGKSDLGGKEDLPY